MLAWAAVAVFAAAACRDLGWRLIDHRLVAALLLLWAAEAALAGWGWPKVAAHLTVGAAAFLATFLLYLAGWMGGGDVKLAVPVFLWAGPQHGLAVLVLISLAGGGLAVLGALAHLASRLPLPAWAGRGLGLISTERGVPYGVALAVGGAVAALSASVGTG